MQEFWDSVYADEAYVFGTEPNRFLLAQKDRLKPGQQALALADGEGRNGVWLAEQGLDVTSVDFSPIAQAKARRLAEARGVMIRFHEADLEHWDWVEARYDLIAAIFIQFAGPDTRARLFARMKQALKPDGLLILQGYTPRQLDYGTGGPSKAENMYTEPMLREAFADMEILHLQEHDEFIAEGYKHHGMSALIDLVARKP